MKINAGVDPAMGKVASRDARAILFGQKVNKENDIPAVGENQLRAHWGTWSLSTRQNRVMISFIASPGGTHRSSPGFLGWKTLNDEDMHSPAATGRAIINMPKPLFPLRWQVVTTRLGLSKRASEGRREERCLT